MLARSGLQALAAFHCRAAANIVPRIFRRRGRDSPSAENLYISLLHAASALTFFPISEADAVPTTFHEGAARRVREEELK